MPRPDGRAADALRPASFERDYTDAALGSTLVRFGRTTVLCTASVDEDVPRWMRGRGKGWVTAEYSMLPGASAERIRREVKDGKPSGRTQEIQRLIGRSLRAVCDMKALGERSITIDCDVLQADGGTRTASICGAWVALHDACSRLVARGALAAVPLTDTCSAISVGIVDGTPLLDLPYVEDVRAEVDMNVVMAGDKLIEVQGTAEGAPFGRDELDALLDLAAKGIGELAVLQREAVATPPPPPVRLVLATANPHKVEEIRAILAAVDLEVELVPRPDEVPDVVEDAPTLEGNARLKAVALAEATGLPALADDTGLEVDALDGLPGVRSARYAGEAGDAAANVAKLLGALAEVPEERRTARFRTVAMVRWPDGREVAAEGVVEGTILDAPRGGGGFGYDPVFAADEGGGLSFAEMDGPAKDAISHRGRAVRALAGLLTAV